MVDKAVAFGYGKRTKEKLKSTVFLYWFVRLRPFLEADRRDSDCERLFSMTKAKHFKKAEKYTHKKGSNWSKETPEAENEYWR